MKHTAQVVTLKRLYMANNMSFVLICKINIQHLDGSATSVAN